MTANFAPKRILCAIDLAEPVEVLIETAASLAARFDAELHIVHVWNPWVSATLDSGGTLPSDAEFEAASRALHDALDGAAALALRVHPRVVTRLVPGTPWQQLVLYADTYDCGLVLAGTHGRRGIARLVTGSVAERVVRESSVPVLVVPISLRRVDDRLTSERDASTRSAS